MMFDVRFKIVAYNVSHNNQAAGQAANILPLRTINSPCTFVFHSVNGWIILIGLRIPCFLPSDIVRFGSEEQQKVTTKREQK